MKACPHKQGAFDGGNHHRCEVKNSERLLTAVTSEVLQRQTGNITAHV